MIAEATLKVKQIIKETADAITIVFEKPASGMNYLAGQFLTLIVKIDGKEYRRAYSLCSAPKVDADLAVTVKRVPKGIVSNYLPDNLKVGDEMEVLEPIGNFVVNPEASNQRHLMMIGGGSGITPLMSMIKTVLTEESASMVSLLFVNRNEESVIFKQALDQLAEKYAGRFRLVNHYSNGNGEEPKKKKGLFGLFSKKSAPASNRLDVSAMGNLLSQFNIEQGDNTEYYICGPEGLMAVAEDCLKQRKVDNSKVFRESFVSNKEDNYRKEHSDESDQSVKVIVGGEEFSLDVPAGRSILDTALDAGIDIPFSCQSGLCTACMGRCTSGEVAMSESDGLTPDQIAQGYVLTCVSHPKGGNVVIEYD